MSPFTSSVRWFVDGQPLSTFAYNVTTLDGDIEGVPPMRGSNTRVPYAPGDRWNSKVPDSRVLVLGMEVWGATEDGSTRYGLQTEEARRLYEKNWKSLRRLFWQPRRQFELTKQWWVLTAELEEAGYVIESGAETQGDYTLYSATAMGQWAGGLSSSNVDFARSRFVVDIELTDPFFYGPEITIPFDTMDSGGSTRTFEVLGDWLTTAIEIDLEGPLTSPLFTNTTEPQDLWLRYATVVDDGETANIRVKEFGATHYPAGLPYKSSGFVSHRGDAFWMYLNPGETTMSLEPQAGTGVAALRYQPAWF